MILARISVLALFALVLTGCDTFNRSAYFVSRVPTSTTAILPSEAEDMAAVGEVLDVVAASFQLSDRRQSSRAERTIRYFVQSVDHFPILLGSRVVGDTILIELEHFHPGIGKTPEYESLERAVLKALRDRFGQRLKIRG